MALILMILIGLMVNWSNGQYNDPGIRGNYNEPNYNERKLDDDSRNYVNNNNNNNNNNNERLKATKPAPVSILKQINRHNEDGSYTYGFEGSDGSFKIETKAATGEVKGKYGFVDDSGSLKVVEYGAGEAGYQPSGEGITVPPPTLFDETTDINGQLIPDYDSPPSLPSRSPPPPQSPPLRLSQSQVPLNQASSSPAYHQRQQFQQTEPIYPRQSQLTKTPIFSPSQPPSQHQPSSQLISNYQTQEQPPPSQALNQGPIQFNPQSSPPSHSTTSNNNLRQGRILDQLAKDYALPQNSAPPLHDITFGFY